jgi:hypothetical protein
VPALTLPLTSFRTVVITIRRRGPVAHSTPHWLERLGRVREDLIELAVQHLGGRCNMTRSCHRVSHMRR